MPKRNDIHKILIIGAGPIIISQACEFDYSGTQACKALKEEGFEIVLVNSNPATIMTDPEFAHRTYVEPVTPDVVARIIEKERPDAILPTLGGQTGLNTAIEVARMGVLERFGVEMIGATTESIQKAEDRDLFRKAMTKIGLRIPASGIAISTDEARSIASEIGFPIIVRPSFTLGGTGGGVAYNPEDLEILAKAGLDASLIGQIMLEQSVLGWKEYELEVMRDNKDNVVIICSIENIDPMGVHTGDSITVAPAQTLSDREYQLMRDASLAIMREIGVDTGGSNVQFAIHPQTGEMIVVEMNPRVSRSSALASKVTGFPIAKIAAKLAVGYTLDEIPNDITGETLASFEPTLDYCVVKIPRWTFEKFPETTDFLTTAMKSVGEIMAIGRTFKEALQKGLRSLEIGRFGLGADGKGIYDPKRADRGLPDLTEIRQHLATPNSSRIFYLRHALLNGLTIEEIYTLSGGIDPWFIYQIQQLVDLEKRLEKDGPDLTDELFRKAKSWGFSDVQLAFLTGGSESDIKERRKKLGLKPVYKLVDTCAAEFEAATPYYYSTYETENEARVSNHKKVMILGGGPNRIGQGIEFDYCCVHASFALREEGVKSIMVNSNPETVSTDYDTSDKLYFEPLTKEDVLHIAETEKPEGVIVQFGGQTPLNLSTPLAEAGVPILGTQPESIDRAEDRKQFQAMLKKLGLIQPANGTATTIEDAVVVAETIGYPVIVRPSFVLGGRAMKIVYTEKELKSFTAEAIQASNGHPVLIDKFLEDAVEVDVDAISDGQNTIIGGIMEHIEEAGIHSGDSACVLPPISISKPMLDQISSATRAMAKELSVIGLMNVQYAIKEDQLYVIEVNPRASRTIPFVSKATGIPFAKLATKVMLGKRLEALGLSEEFVPDHISVKEAVLPFDRFPDVDTLLGPEMKSTGEVMGIDMDFGTAYAKAQFGARQNLPVSGTVFISVQDAHKKYLMPVAQQFEDLGFSIMTTTGTHRYLQEKGIESRLINKVSMGRPHVVDAIKNGEVQLIINTGSGDESRQDGYQIRRAALKYQVPYTTTIAGGRAVCRAIAALKAKTLTVKPLQEYHNIGRKYRMMDLDKPREACGIFGIHNHQEAEKLTYFGLYALQHRGQESAGIATLQDNTIVVHKGMGLVSDVFDMTQLEQLKGTSAIGHVRYSTTGSSILNNAQPFVVHHRNRSYAVAHNGNLVNAHILKKELEATGSIFQTTNDSEIFLHLFVKNLKHGFEGALVKTVERLQGAFSFVLLTNEGEVIGIKDPHSFRPLCLGKLNGSYVLASESCALDLVEAEMVRELAPGEIVIIGKDGIKSIQTTLPATRSFCIFEFIYFARPDSTIFGKNVYQMRKAHGRRLAQEAPVDADLVMPFPDSGTYAALGYSEASRVPFEMVMIRNHYVGRTFIQPTQSMRDFGVRIKLNPVKELLKGKDIIIIEDSIIRGTTAKTRVKALRSLGANRVHMRVAGPPHRFPCHYGIDFSTKGELIAASKSVRELKDFLGLDSLHYLSLAGLLTSTGFDAPENHFCKACFDGCYPVEFDKFISKDCLERNY